MDGSKSLSTSLKRDKARRKDKSQLLKWEKSRSKSRVNKGECFKYYHKDKRQIAHYLRIRIMISRKTLLQVLLALH